MAVCALSKMPEYPCGPEIAELETIMAAIRDGIAVRRSNVASEIVAEAVIPTHIDQFQALPESDFITFAGLAILGRPPAIAQIEWIKRELAAGSSRAKILTQLQATENGGVHAIQGLGEQFAREQRRRRMRAVACGTGLIVPFRLARRVWRASRRLARGVPRLIRLDETLNDVRIMARADYAPHHAHLAHQVWLLQESDKQRAAMEVHYKEQHANLLRQIRLLREDGRLEERVASLTQRIALLEGLVPTQTATFTQAVAAYAMSMAAEPWHADVVYSIVKDLPGTVLDLDHARHLTRLSTLNDMGLAVRAVAEDPVLVMNDQEAGSVAAVLVAVDATVAAVDALISAARHKLAQGGVIILPPRVFVGGAECAVGSPVALLPTPFVKALILAHGMAAEEIGGVILARRGE
jgi:hypothetical protein